MQENSLAPIFPHSNKNKEKYDVILSRVSYIVFIVVSTSPQKHHLFFAKSPLNLQTVQAPILGNPPQYIGFS